LVFVEVKARANFDAAAEAVTARQQARIIDAAQYWLAAHPDAVSNPLRFDAVLVVPGKIPRHLPGAFDATRQPR
jgi:putative endonuclease